MMASKKSDSLYSGDRYTFDMQQAEAMRAGSQRQVIGAESSLSSSRTDANKRVTKNDIALALRGLEQAEAQKVQGDKESALKLYGLSLELLILYLKDEETAQRMPSINRDNLAARVSVALSDAEELKQQISNSTCQSSSPSSSVRGMLASLRNSLLGPSDIDEQSPLRPSTSQSKQSTSSQGKNLQQEARPFQRNKGMRKALCRSSSKGMKTSHGHTQPSGPTVANKTAMTLTNAAKNQLYKMVLDDLYVAPEALQNTSWDDIAGLEEVKQYLQESAILPLVRPDLFTGLRKPQNILLFGPPGTGKTLLVRAAAKESGSSLFVCSASSITSKWMGEAEKLVKALFQVARDVSPSILFLDEVDALLSTRKSDGEHEASRRLKTEFMVQMEGITSDEENRVLILACTNCPWDMDSAVLRRFPRRIFVPLPDTLARRALVKRLLKKAGKHSLTKQQQIDDVVARLYGFSCSDIVAIASEASFGPIRSLGGLAAVMDASEKDMRPINSADFEEAIRKATKSVSVGQQEKFDKWRQEQSAG